LPSAADSVGGDQCDFSDARATGFAPGKDRRDDTQRREGIEELVLCAVRLTAGLIIVATIDCFGCAFGKFFRIGSFRLSHFVTTTSDRLLGHAFARGNERAPCANRGSSNEEKRDRNVASRNRTL
jgi:hypothetical protein